MIYISIGSNLGNRLHNLRLAVEQLKERYLTNVQCSIVLETTCILPEGAPASWDKPFLNMIVAGEAHCTPQELLIGLKNIEREIGRPEHYERWSPRIIDLDILLWDDLTLDTPQLKIPHPELKTRDFLTHLLAMMNSPYPAPALTPCFLNTLALFPAFVGIVNITADSFSDGGRFNTPEAAMARALQLAKEGASIIEIGAQSTRAGAIIKSPEEEYSALQPVLEGLTPLIKDGTITLSVDTFTPSIIQNLLEKLPPLWINDVKGALDHKTLKAIAEHGSKLCVMHAPEIPANKNTILPLDQSPINILRDWAEKQIEQLLSLGFKKENIILDPGIGYGKSAYQDLEILRHLEALKACGVSILVGHSRKYYLQTLLTRPAAERDLETIAVSALLAQAADYLRVHNVADHQRFFVAQQALIGGL